MRALILATLLLVLPGWASAQPISILHVKVVLLDAERRPTPVPRHALLVSDNPPTASPRRVVTGLDGTVDVKLRPGSYTVESDEPAVLNGKAYRWTQMLDVTTGRDVTLELTAGNAEVEDAATAAATTTSASPPAGDPSLALARWQDSVVTLWTPTSPALGFVVDARGLVATNQRVIRGATSVEVELTPEIKVAGRVLAADPARDVAVVWIDPTVAAASVRPLPLECERMAKLPVVDGQEIFTIDAPLRGQRSLTPGTVTHVEPRAVLADFRVEPRRTGGPVFTADGGVVGIASPVDEADGRKRGDSRIVRLAEACEVLRLAEQKMQDAAPPSGTLLPMEPARRFPVDALEDAVQRRAGASPYQVSSSDFDIAFITPVLAYVARHRGGSAGGPGRSSDIRRSEAARDRFRLLTDFGNWSEYVADVPPVLLVRVTPRFVEGFWTKVGRGAAYTQGASLPPFKHFKPGFWRMQAFCGTSEVTPIHAFTLEQRISEGDAVREGLYVFDPGALGPPCGTVKLVLFSEKEPRKGDTRVVDPGVLEQVWRDFAPYRAVGSDLRRSPDLRGGRRIRPGLAGLNDQGNTYCADLVAETAEARRSSRRCLTSTTRVRARLTANPCGRASERHGPNALTDGERRVTRARLEPRSPAHALEPLRPPDRPHEGHIEVQGTLTPPRDVTRT